MLCPSCSKQNRDNAQFCSGCGQPLIDELLRQLDLCIVMDATGSMKDYIEVTRKELKAFAQKLYAHDIKPGIAYALVLYRDHPPSENSFVTQSYAFSENLEDLQKALDGARAKGGGGDGAEAVVDGLYVASHDLKWRENAHKVIVLVGDAPPHGWGSPKDRFPKGCPCEDEHGTVVDVAKNARVRGISIFSLGIGDTVAMKKSFEEIAKHGGGHYVSISHADTLIDEVLAVMGDEFGKVRIDRIVQSAYEPGSTPQSIAAVTSLKIGEVDESMNRLRRRKLIN